MPHTVAHPGRDSMSRAVRAECAAAYAPALWLLLVGVVTSTLIHHVLHAIPVAILAVMPRSPWVRHTAALTGLAWVLMLALLTPMIRDVLERGIHTDDPALAYTWLAPAMVAISALWAGLNAAILSSHPTRWWWYALFLLALAVVLAAVHPQVSGMFDAPLNRVLEGDVRWGLALLGELVLLLAIPWWALRSTWKHRGTRLTRRSAIGQIAYWLLFLTCMVTGLLPSLN